MRSSASPGPSKSKSGDKKSLGIASAALVTTLTIAKESLDGVPAPGLKAAVSGLLEIIKAVNKIHENAQDLNELDAHLNDLADLLKSISEKKEKEITPDLNSRVSKLTTDIEKIVESCGTLRSQSSILKFFAHHDNASAISGMNRSIDRAIQAFQLGGTLSIEQGIARIEKRLERTATLQVLPDPNDPLSLLRPYVADARYDSASRLATVSRCLEGTRSDLLQNIFNWVDDPHSKSIYWLCGRAGTGKSTIAQTVAEGLNKRHILGASFFFSGDVAERSNALLVFPTLAYQLGRFHSSFSSQISTSLKNYPDSCSSMLQTQLEKLIAGPLQYVTDVSQTVVIVIDALDECSDEALAQEMLVLLASSVIGLPFRIKIFITSRPDVHIRSKFDEPAMKSVSEASLLHDIDVSVVQHDIGLYLSYHLRRIGKDMLGEAGWPADDDLVVLVDRAKGLFIYASASIAYIGDKRHRKPGARLKELLSDQPVDAESPFAEVDGLYRNILHGSLPQVGARSFAKQLQPILAAIVLLLDPLSPQAIERLLSIDTGTIRPVLVPLHSVLSVPEEPEEPVRVSHQSFSDFMTDSKRCTDSRLLVEPGIHHPQLALQCIDLMNSTLQRNMCGIKDQFMLNAKIPDLAVLLELKTGAHLVYACRFWAFHLKYADSADRPLRNALTIFATTKLLYWLEVLSLSQHLDSALLSLKIAQEWYQEEESKRLTLVRKMIPSSGRFNPLEQRLRSAETELMKIKNPVRSLLLDCHFFLLRFFEPISKSASQIYHSALPFTPFCSLYHQFEAELNGSVHVLPRGDSWDPSLSVLQGHAGAVWSVCYSPDGLKIASGSSDCMIHLWESSTGAHIRTMRGHSQSVRSIGFSPDGSRILSGSGDLTMRLWDSTTGAQIRILEDHSQSIWSVCFSHDGSKIASGSDDHSVRLWDPSSGACVKILDGHSASVSSICFSPNGLTIASASDDHSARLWNIDQGTAVRLDGHSQAVRSICFSLDGTRIATGSGDRTVRLWEYSAGACLKVLEGHSASVWSVCFSPDGSKIASGSGDKTLRLWRSTNGTHIRTLEGHSEPVRSVCFSPDGSRIISGSSDHTVHLWDYTAGMHVKTSKRHSQHIQALCLSPDGARIASGSHDHTVSLWDLATSTYIMTLEGHTAPIFSVSFSPDASWIASGSGDCTIILWDSSTGTKVRVLIGHSQAVRSICFSHDGRRIASGSDDHRVHLWDCSSGICIEFKGHSQPVYSVSFSFDGAVIASGSADLAVRLWDANTCNCLRTMEGHAAAVQTVCFSPYGSNLASGSEDHTVRLWDFNTSNPTIGTLKGHSDPVKSVCFSSDGSHIRSCSSKGEEILWDPNNLKRITRPEVIGLGGDGCTEDDQLSSGDGVEGKLFRNNQSIIFRSPSGSQHHICLLPISNISCHIFFGDRLVIGTQGGYVYFLNFSSTLQLLR